MYVPYRAVVNSSPEIIRSSLLPFLTFAAEDLTQTVANLKIGRFSHVKGTITRGATSLNYVHMVLLPVLTSMFDHLSRNNFGNALLGELFGNIVLESQKSFFFIVQSKYIRHSEVSESSYMYTQTLRICGSSILTKGAHLR